MFSDCGCGCKGKKQEKKMLISLMSATLFYIVANPKTFLLVRSLLSNGISNAAGCPTNIGLLVHALVFFLITWSLMNI
jgi:hypothetical protein